MAKTQVLKFKRTVQAPPPAVFRALTNSTALREWFSDIALTEPRKGGRFYAAWNSGYYAMGEFTKLSPDRKATLAWLGRGEPAATLVKLSVAEKQAGTAVSVAHEGVGTGKKWAAAAEALTRLWERALENLQSVLETGEDLRFTLRPMLGVVGLEEVDAALAARLAMPTPRGLRLDGTVPGLGAEAAGLQKDDVILAFGGHPVHSYGNLTAALATVRAGDTVPVTLFRAGAQQTLDLTLSKRPLPQIPATAHALAEAVRAIYNRQEAELNNALAGVTDAEAEFKSAPGEWSIKEVLAHLIHSERGSQQFIASTVTGSAPYYDSFGGNCDAWVQATASVYPTLAAMVAGLQQAGSETVGLLAALPDSFVARKGSYWQVAYSTLEGGFHIQDHLAQIAANLSAARAAQAATPAAGA